MNIDLLRAVAEVIQKKPRRLNMAMWHRNSRGRRAWYSLEDSKARECGTTHCIGGWAHLLHSPDNTTSYTENVATSALGITERQANRLFFVTFWPEPFRTRYENLTTHTALAKVAAARIEHFIATDGRE